MDTEKKRLAGMQQVPVQIPTLFGSNAPNYSNGQTYPIGYHQIIERCRYYYENDSIAGTVINRMTDIASTSIKNRHRKYSNEIKYYYDGLAEQLSNLIRDIPLSYLIDGMAIPEYKTDVIMGNRLHSKLGRTRYIIPKAIWLRDAMQIVVKKSPLGGRILYFKVPKADIKFINDKGKPDREQEYKDLESLYPEYVTAVKAGKKEFLLENCKPIMRKLTTYNDYPLPFLKNAIPAIDQRQAYKRMDKITAERVVYAIRQVSVGNDEYPADDDDISAAKNTINASGHSQETIINLYTNHTIQVNWIIPPLEGIMDSNKYVEANSDVFMGMGFPRLWAVGENERSNSSDNKIASVGPIAAIERMRSDIMQWITWLYQELAELNGFTQYPTPYWMPFNQASVVDLLQYAAQYVENGTISKNTGATLFNSTYEVEQEQIIQEQKPVLPVTQETVNTKEMVSNDSIQEPII